MQKVECTGYQYLVRSYWLLWINCKNNCPIFFFKIEQPRRYSLKNKLPLKKQITPKMEKKIIGIRWIRLACFSKLLLEKIQISFCSFGTLIKCFTSEVTRCRCHRHLVQIYLCWNKWFVSRYICHRTIFWIKMDRF